MTTPLKAVAAGGNSAELREWVAGDFLPVANGGTGGTTAATARSNLGLGSAAVAAIVGTVSQSGGVPTGAIIQRGSNANGEFVRYADGTQECWVDLTFSAAINVADGALYLSPAVATWTFPASFVGAVSVVSQSTGNGAFGLYPVSDSVSTTVVDGVYLVSSSSRTSATRRVTRIAKGRWF